MSDRVESPKKQGSIAGAGIGTGYIGVLSLIPDNHHWLRDLLTLAAPALTIGASVLWVFGSAWAMKKMVNWHLRGAIKDAEEILADLESDSKATEEDRTNARGAVSDLKRLRVDALTQSVADVRARLTELRG